MDAWVHPFLEALRACGVQAKAARAAGVAYGTVQSRRQADADFAAACDEALAEASDTALEELRRRAIEGVAEPIVYQGAITYEVERDERGDPVRDPVHDSEGLVVGHRSRLKLDEHGQPIPVVVRKPSDALLLALVKATRPEFRVERTEITGAGGEPVKVEESVRVARLSSLLALAEQRKKAAEDLA